MASPPKHHMLREIFEQPAAVLRTFEAAQMDSASCSLYQRSWKNAKLQDLSRIVIAASGTSRHAGIAGEFMIESLAGIPVDVDYASEFQFSPDRISRETLTIVITQSGETADTILALRYSLERGALCLGITNTVGSTISRETHCGVHINAGPEIGVASTKVYTFTCFYFHCFF